MATKQKKKAVEDNNKWTKDCVKATELATERVNAKLKQIGDILNDFQEEWDTDSVSLYGFYSIGPGKGEFLLGYSASAQNTFLEFYNREGSSLKMVMQRYDFLKKLADAGGMTVEEILRAAENGSPGAEIADKIVKNMLKDG
jgi:hypothetical protein